MPQNLSFASTNFQQGAPFLQSRAAHSCCFSEDVELRPNLRTQFWTDCLERERCIKYTCSHFTGTAALVQDKGASIGRSFQVLSCDHQLTFGSPNRLWSARIPPGLVIDLHGKMLLSIEQPHVKNWTDVFGNKTAQLTRPKTIPGPVLQHLVLLQLGLPRIHRRTPGEIR